MEGERAMWGNKTQLTTLVIFGFLLLASPPSAVAWSYLGGGDHNGEDWIITSDTEIAGVHYNIRVFRIEQGVTVRVKQFDGSNFGQVTIMAENIVVNGTLSADNAGYMYPDYPGPGGGGGGGYGTGGLGGAAYDNIDNVCMGSGGGWSKYSYVGPHA
ncbi:MAG: hypothetical protein QXH08_06865, partial [Candidatus Hadarchaeales archaeon]